MLGTFTHKQRAMNFTLLSDMSLAGFLTILVLFACSVIMLALGWELHKRGRSKALDGDWLLVQIRYLLVDKSVSLSGIQDYLSHLDRPLGNICRELLNLKPLTLESGDYLLASLVDKERLKLEQGLSHLGTIAVIAPFVGLFGTVVGITKTFADVAKMGKAGIEVVSAGVSEALVATAIGLLVAIISVVMFNFFKKSFANEVSNWDIAARSLLSLLASDEGERDALFASGQADYQTSSAERFLDGAKLEAEPAKEESGD